MPKTHTPGKLRVEYVGARNCEDGSMADVCEIRNEGGDLIADYMDKDTAHLFAAAPDLLAALEMICDSGIPLSDAITDKMLAAIARARA